MKKNITSNNHYIPCFWSALWNIDNLKVLRNGEKSTKSCRKIMLRTLGVEANKIYSKKTENLFLNKHSNSAVVENKKDFEHLKNLFSNVETNFEKFDEDNLYVFDYENKFTALENIYKETLFNVVRKKTINFVEE